MGDLLPALPTLGPISNRQRWDAALTVAELQGEMPEDVAYFLVLLGLAEERDGDFHAVGRDEEGRDELGRNVSQGWFAQFRRRAAAAGTP